MLLASMFSAFPVHAQGTAACPYNLQSLQGTYTVIGNYGSNVAIALAVRHFDGMGNLSGTFTVNEPTAGTTTGARTIVTGTQAGTYTVNCDGTGKTNRVLTTNGVSTNQVDDFVITAAVWSLGGFGNWLVATGVVDAQETSSTIVAGGIFLSRTYTRLPDSR